MPSLSDIWNAVHDESDDTLRVKVLSGGGTDPVGLKNVAGTPINPATEDTLASIKNTDGIKKITDPLPAGTNAIGKVQELALDGATADGVKDLTSANTWYDVPSTVPANPYILVAVPAKANTGDIRWSFDNGGTPGVGNGVLAPGMLMLRLAANEVVRFGSTVAGDDIEWTTKEIV